MPINPGADATANHTTLRVDGAPFQAHCLLNTPDSSLRGFTPPRRWDLDAANSTQLARNLVLGLPWYIAPTALLFNVVGFVDCFLSLSHSNSNDPRHSSLPPFTFLASVPKWSTSSVSLWCVSVRRSPKAEECRSFAFSPLPNHTFHSAPAPSIPPAQPFDTPYHSARPKSTGLPARPW